VKRPRHSSKLKLVMQVFEYSLSTKPCIEHVKLEHQGRGRGSLSDSVMATYRQRVFRSTKDLGRDVKKLIEAEDLQAFRAARGGLLRYQLTDDTRGSWWPLRRLLVGLRRSVAFQDISRGGTARVQNLWRV
jgi:hypothetical protein